MRWLLGALVVLGLTVAAEAQIVIDLRDAGQCTTSRCRHFCPPAPRQPQCRIEYRSEAVCESVPMWGYLYVNGCHQRVCLGYTSVIRYRRVPYLVCN
jgi:hypothetical protein